MPTEIGVEAARSMAMLQSIVAPNKGHPIVHHFREGASVWGQSVTASVAHLVQSCREVTIDYSRVGPGIVFEVISGSAKLPHIIGASNFRFHAEASAFRHAASRSNPTVDAVLHVNASDECVLKLWGRVSVEDSASAWDNSVLHGQNRTIPVLFAVTFWEISRAPDDRSHLRARNATEIDRRIHELEAAVALSMCSQ
jgi:hypothetical protein